MKRADKGILRNNQIEGFNKHDKSDNGDWLYHTLQYMHGIQGVNVGVVLL